MNILVGTARGLEVLGGAAPRGLEGSVTHLARAATSLWAVSDGSRIWRAEGGRWTRIARIEDLRLNCVLPLADGSAYVGTSEAHLLGVRREGVERVRSFDEAEGRASWYTPWGGPPDVRSLSADPEGRLYANVHVGGILSSADRGRTWEPTGIDKDADVHQVLAHPREAGVVLAATAFGLAISKDRGRTWTTHDEGLHASYCRAVAVTEDGALVSASEGPRGRHAALYLHRGGRFTRCEEGLPEWFEGNIDTHCLSAAGRTAAFGSSDGSLFLSTDAGGSWERVGENLGAVTAMLLDTIEAPAPLLG